MEVGIATLLMLVDIIIFWKLVSIVYHKQWDVFSSKFVFSIVTLLVGVAIVAFVSDTLEGKAKVFMLIFGSTLSIFMVLLNLAIFYLVRKMKYVEATIPLSVYKELKKYGGELKEDTMVCLIPRKDIFDVEILLEKTKTSKNNQNKKIEKLDDSEEIQEIE
jgi:hypothetical protein